MAIPDDSVTVTVLVNFGTDEVDGDEEGSVPRMNAAAALSTQLSSTASVVFIGRAKQLVSDGQGVTTKPPFVPHLATSPVIHAACGSRQADSLVRLAKRLLY